MKKINQLTERWEYLDILKCIGIIFVIIYHSTIYNYNWIASPNITHYLRYFLTTLLSTCVPLFFFTNGYLLLNKDFDLKKTHKKNY